MARGISWTHNTVDCVAIVVHEDAEDLRKPNLLVFLGVVWQSIVVYVAVEWKVSLTLGPQLVR